MDATERWKKLRAAQTRAAEEARASLTALKERPPGPRRGDAYHVGGVDPDDDLDWVVIQEHPDDPDLLYVVPADGDPLAGSTDVIVADRAAFGPATLRCGRGLWLPAAFLAGHGRVGFYEDRYVERAREKLALLVRGRSWGSAEQRRADRSPAYEARMDEIAQVVGRLEALVASQAQRAATAARLWAFSVTVLLAEAGRRRLALRGLAAGRPRVLCAPGETLSDPTLADGTVLHEDEELQVRVAEIAADGEPVDGDLSGRETRLALAIERLAAADDAPADALEGVRLFAPGGREVPADELRRPLHRPALQVWILSADEERYELEVASPPLRMTLEVERQGATGDEG